MAESLNPFNEHQQLWEADGEEGEDEDDEDDEDEDEDEETAIATAEAGERNEGRSVSSGGGEEKKKKSLIFSPFRFGRSTSKKGADGPKLKDRKREDRGTGDGGSLSIAAVAELSKESLDALQSCSATFDASLKQSQKRAILAVKVAKAERKAAMGDEALRFSRQMAHAKTVKKRLIKVVKKVLSKQNDTTQQKNIQDFDFDACDDYQIDDIILGDDDDEEEDEKGEKCQNASDDDEEVAVVHSTNKIKDGKTSGIDHQASTFDLDTKGGSTSPAIGKNASIAASTSAPFNEVDQMKTQLELPLDKSVPGTSMDGTATPLEQLRYFTWYEKLVRAKYTSLHLNNYFPREEGWKMRVYIPEEDMYMGYKDVSVERLKWHADLSLGNEGVKLDIKDLELLTQVYQMRFKGKTKTAKALKKLLSPEMVRLGLHGTISVHVQYSDKKKRWGSKKCTFDLRVNKRISGAVTVPDSVVRSLLNSILPRLVRRLLIRAIPKELGLFLKKVPRNICTSFTVEVAEVIPRTVWTASLFESAEARGLLGLERREVAVLCSVLAQGNACRVSGLQETTVSIDSLYGYLLKYGSNTAAWADLLEVWEERFRNICPDVTGRGWVTYLFNGIHELGRKPLQAEVSIIDIDLEVNIQQCVTLWSEIFINKINYIIKRADDMKLPHINFKAPQEVAAAAQELVLTVNSSVAFAMQSLDRACSVVDLEMLGGNTMKVMMKAASTEMKATLPRRIDLLTSPLKIELPRLVICTELDEPTGGYHIEVIWRGKLPSTIHSESNNATEDGKLQTSKQGSEDMDDENEKTTLLVATAFVASFGLSLKSGRLLCTSEEFSGRVAIQSTLIENLMLPPPSSENFQTPTDAYVDGAVSSDFLLPTFAERNENDDEVKSHTTKADVEKAVLAFIFPILFEDEHEASLIINQLQVTASSPAAAPEELNVSLKSASYGAAGKIDLKLDITTILTDVLDLVEMSENVVSY